MSRRDFDWNDVAGKFGGKGEFADCAEGAVFGHKDGAATGNAFDHAEETAATSELRVRRHLDGAAHPGKFSGLGDDRVVGIEKKFEDRHGGSGDAALHECAPIDERPVNDTADIETWFRQERVDP